MATREPTWEVYEIVAELIEQGAERPPSRNRHFEAWQDQTRGAAYRLYGRLLSIHDDLLKLREDGGTPAAAASDEQAPVQLAYELQQIPQGAVTRRTEWLRPEWELLAAICGELTPSISLHGSPALPPLSPTTADKAPAAKTATEGPKSA